MTEHVIPYAVKLTVRQNIRVKRAAKAAKVSDGRYIQALFEHCCTGRIGTVRVGVEDGSVDGMGHLTGRIKMLSDASAAGQTVVSVSGANVIGRFIGPEPAFEGVISRPDAEKPIFDQVKIPKQQMRGVACVDVTAVNVYRYLCEHSKGQPVSISQLKMGKDLEMVPTKSRAAAVHLSVLGLIRFEVNGSGASTVVTAPFKKTACVPDAPSKSVLQQVLTNKELSKLGMLDTHSQTYQVVCRISAGKNIMLSLSALGQKISMTPVSARKHLKKLADAGVIDYMARDTNGIGSVCAPNDFKAPVQKGGTQ